MTRAPLMSMEFHKPPAESGAVSSRYLLQFSALLFLWITVFWLGVLKRLVQLTVW